MDDEKLIDLIYEAGAMPSKWPDFLGTLRDNFGSRAALLLALTDEGLHGLQSDGFSEHRADYNAAGWDKDTTRFDWLVADEYPGFRTDTDFASCEELAKIPLYAEFLTPRGIDAGAATLVPGADGDRMLLSLEAFPDHEAARAVIPRLDLLRPHLARGAMLSAQMRLQQSQAAVAALGLIGAGAAVVSSSGKVRAVNDRFEALNFATTGAGDQIRLHERGADQRLHLALAQLAAGGRGASLAVRIGRKQVVALHILPVRGVARDLFTDSAAILVVSNPGLSAAADESLIRHLYDLTPAEARIASAIGRGHKVDRIAIDSGIAVGTVRNHLKAVFLKAGVTSQTELALLLAQFARPPAL